MQPHGRGGRGQGGGLDPTCLRGDDSTVAPMPRGNRRRLDVVSLLALGNDDIPSAMALASPGPLRTPVALIIFNRPDLTAQLFAAIRQARPQRLFVIADGPRHEGERALCQATREVINVDWDCELSTTFSDVNLGCKVRPASGIDWVFQQCEEAIILEDDTLPSPSFFYFCQALLERYRDDERVMNIGGTNLDLRPRSGLRPESYHFARYGHTSGWASWRRAWKHFDLGMSLWPELKRAGRIQDLFESRAEQLYWTMLFDAQYEDRMDAWDYQWLFARLVQSGLTAVPSVNMIANLGFRADATHHSAGMPAAWRAARQNHDLHELVHPSTVFQCRDADRHQFAEIVNPRGMAGLALFGLQRLRQTLAG
jgi:hypothetical protein